MLEKVETTVCADDEGRYVEAGSSCGFLLRYRSDDLPAVGTDVTVDPYTGTDDGHYADVSWSADCPAGYSFTTARAFSI